MILNINDITVKPAPYHEIKSQFVAVPPPSRAKVVPKERIKKIKVAATSTIRSTTTGLTNSAKPASIARTRCRASAKQAKPAVSVY